MATDVNGATLQDSNVRYLPFGEQRVAGAGMPTDRLYTGQRWDAGIGLYDYNARYYDPALGRFVQADTIVPEPGNPQSLNRYAYVKNNPLRYTDPSGYFSEEQLNWMGYKKEDVSEDIWRFLLTLQPGDVIGGAEQSDLRSLVIGQRSYDQDAEYGLWLSQGDERVELVEWLSDQADLSEVWAYRFGAEMQVRAWDAAFPIRGTFYGQSAQLVDSSGSLVITKEGVASTRRFSSGIWEAILGSIPIVGPILEANSIASTDIPPGHLEGDVRMRFQYVDYDARDALIVTNRTVWLRRGAREKSLVMISDEWTSYYPPAGPSPVDYP